MNKLILTPVAFLMFMLVSFGINAADYSPVSLYASESLSSELQLDVIKDEDDGEDDDEDEGADE